MKKSLVLLLSSLIAGNSFASIPYCPGTSVNGSKDEALQKVVTEFANQNRCEIGNNCLLNFDGVKYSVAWSKPCPLSASHLNSPFGSTFICQEGTCFPYGFTQPSAQY